MLEMRRKNSRKQLHQQYDNVCYFLTKAYQRSRS